MPETQRLTVKNTYQIPLVSINAAKIWEGGPDEKPAVWFQLNRKLETDSVFSAVSNASVIEWQEAAPPANPVWQNIELTSLSGMPYTFTILEGTYDPFTGFQEELPANYTQKEVTCVQDEIDPLITCSLTNQYVSPTYSIRGEKFWHGVSQPVFADGFGFAMQLQRKIKTDGAFTNHQEPKQVTPTSNIPCTATWYNVDATDPAGNPYEYRIVEGILNLSENSFTSGVPGYRTAHTSSVETQTGNIRVDITNQEISQIHGKLIWQNGPVPKPDVQIQLMRTVGGITEPVPGLTPQPITTSADIPQQEITVNISWPKVETTDGSGNPYTFSIHEVEQDSAGNWISSTPAGYRKAETDLTVTNTFIVLENASAIATKQWVNGSHDDHVQVTMELYRKTETGALEKLVNRPPTKIEPIPALKRVVYSWSNLPETDNFGAPYQYFFTESIVPTNFTLSFSLPEGSPLPAASAIINGVEYGYSDAIANNTYASPTWSTISFVKTWAGAPAADYYVQLYQQLAGSGTAYADPIRLDGTADCPDNATSPCESSPWATSWQNAPQTDINGVKYTYSVKEGQLDTGNNFVEGVPGYQSAAGYGCTEHPETNEIKCSLLNTQLVNVIGKKVWLGGSAAKPPVYFRLYQKIGDNAPEYVAQSDVLLDGVSDDPSACPASPGGCELTAWEATFPNLPASTVENQPITYSLVEFYQSGTELLKGPPAGYALGINECDSEPDQFGNFNCSLQNIALRSVQANKVWLGMSETEVPPQISIELKRGVNNSENEMITDPDFSAIILLDGQADGTIEKPCVPDGTLGCERENWVVDWNLLPEKDPTGKLYIYYVEEVPVAGFLSSVSGLTITNTKTSDFTTAKIWEGGPGKSATFQLHRKVDEIPEIDEEIGTPVTFNGDPDTDETCMTDPDFCFKESDPWVLTWSGLPNADADGNLYIYSVTETPIEGYTADSLTCTVENGSCAITNTQNVDISVTKEWLGITPEVTASAFTLTNDKNLTIPDNILTITTPALSGTFSDLPRYYINSENVQEPITYTITETTIPTGYTASEPCIVLSDSPEPTCTIVNTEMASIELIKEWIGTPGTVTLHIGTTVGGTETASQMIDVGTFTTGDIFVEQGNYYLSESDPSLVNYSTELKCFINSQEVDVSYPLEGKIELQNPGDKAICTFYNTELASIELKKKWVGFTDSVTLQIGKSPDSGDIASQITDDAILSTDVQLVAPGSYYLSESGLDPFNFDSALDCLVNDNPYDNISFPENREIILNSSDRAICTFTNTAIEPRLLLVKEFNPANSGTLANWTLRATGTGATPSNLSGVSDSNDVDSSLKFTEAHDFLPDTYTLSETGAPRTDADHFISGTSWSCTGTQTLSNVTQVTLDYGDNVTCTIINTAIEPRLKLVKEFDPADSGTPANWTLSATGTIEGASNISYSADSQYLDSNIAFGEDNYFFPDTYTLFEVGGPGTDADQFIPGTSWSCLITGTETPVTVTDNQVTLAYGDDVTCTIKNTKKGTITVDKVTLPAGDKQNFGFTTTGTGYTGFSLTDEETPNAQMLPPGNYSVAETAQEGWALTSAICTSSITDKAQSASAINLEAGESVTCTFTNTKQGTITVDKVTVPAGDLQSFAFTTTGEGFAGFSLTDTADPNKQKLQPGTYSVAETAQDGWTLTSATCTSTVANKTQTIGKINLEAGEHVTCTFTNTKKGTITIEKRTIPASSSASFAFSGDFIPDTVNKTIKDGEKIIISNLPLIDGAYIITEAPLDGWKLTELTCSDSEISTGNPRASVVNLENAEAQIFLDADESITCIFTSKQLTSVTGEKIWQDGENPALRTAIELQLLRKVKDSADEPAPVPGLNPIKLDGTETQPWIHTWQNLDPKNSEEFEYVYSVDEVVVPNGYDKSIREDGLAVINTLKGALTIQLSTIPKTNLPFTFVLSSTAADPSAEPVQFELDDDGLEGTVGGNLLDNNKSFPTIPSGPYTIEESNLPAGWSLTGIQCCTPIQDDTGNEIDCLPLSVKIEENAVQIEILPGVAQRCVFTNTNEAQQGKILTDKITWPATGNELDAPSFNFTTFGVGFEPFSLTDGDPANQQIMTPGEYSLSENSVTDWLLVDAVCKSSIDGKAQSPEKINLAAGEIVSCTFHNAVSGSVAIKLVTVPNGATQKFQFISTITELNARSLMDGEINVAQIKTNKSGLSPVSNAWLMTEVVPANWKLIDLECTELMPEKPTTFSIDLARNQVEIYPNAPYSGVSLCVFTNTLLDTSGEAENSDSDHSDPPVENALEKTVPETGFPVGLISALPVQPPAKMYTATEMRLNVPSLNISLPIIGIPESDEGWDVTWLSNQAGWLAGSAWPTWNGNTVLTAHVWDAYNQPGPFADIKNLRFGDQFEINSLGKNYIYEVRENKLIRADHVDEMMQPEKEDWVTLVTCENYDAQTQEYSSRRLVRAVLIRYK